MNEDQTRKAIKCRLKLKKNYLAIKKNLRVDEIGGFLFQEGVITDDQWSDLNNLTLGEHQRMHRLFDIVYQTPDDRMETAFNTFIRSFENDTDWLADQILRFPVTEEDVNVELQRFAERYPAPQYAVLGLPGPVASSSVNSNASTSSYSNAAAMIGTAGGTTSSAASGEVSLSNEHADGQLGSNDASGTQHATSASHIEPMDQDDEVPKTENEPGTIAYTAGILVYRFIRDRWPRSSARGSAEAATTASAGPSSSRQPDAPSALESFDESDAVMRNVSYGTLANEFASESHALGVGQLQTTLDMRGTIKSLRELGDLFDLQYGHHIDTLVDDAINGNMQDTPNWFANLAREVLRDGVSWGRIISLFVFASRFALRAITNIGGSVIRRLGAVVFGFADFIRDVAASWLSGEGGWSSLLDPLVTNDIRSQMTREQQLRSISDNNLAGNSRSLNASNRSPEQEQPPSRPSGSAFLSLGAVIFGAAVAISAGAYVWYRGGR